MGGRSGQRLSGSAGSSGTAGAAQAPPQGNAVVEAKGFGKGGSATYSEFGQAYAREIGLNGSIAIERVGSGELQGGYVRSIYDPKTDTYRMEQTVFVKGGAAKLTEYQVQEVVKHEMTHLKQFQDGRLSMKKVDGVLFKMWEGKPYISQRKFENIMNGFNARTREARQSAYRQYRELPWEVEAHNAGDPFKNEVP